MLPEITLRLTITANGAPVDFSMFPLGSFVEILPNHNW